MTINSILLNIDLILGSYVTYVNVSPLPLINSFYPNVSPGYNLSNKIVQIPNPKLVFYLVTRNEINRMRVWLTDQDNKPVDLRGATLTVKIMVREVIDLYNLIREYFSDFKISFNPFYKC